MSLSQTDVILPPFGKSDFSVIYHKVCTFKWALPKTVIFDLYLVFLCTVTFVQGDQKWQENAKLEGRYYKYHPESTSKQKQQRTLKTRRITRDVT